jgi:hypothetical protein
VTAASGLRLTLENMEGIEIREIEGIPAAAERVGTPAATPRLELAVMETVVNALTRLPDRPARERVARWALSVLDSETTTPTTPSAAASLETRGAGCGRDANEDLQLSVRDLEHLFEKPEKPAVPPVFVARVRSGRRRPAYSAFLTFAFVARLRAALAGAGSLVA